MRNRRSLATALLVVLSLVFAACGGGDTADTTAAADGETTTTSGGTDTTTETTGADTETTMAAEDVTLRVLIHQNPTFTAFMEQFNADFEAANPGVTVDMSVVDPADMATSIQTRLTAADVDVIDYCVAPCAGFSNPIQPYMAGISAPPTWQQLIEAGLVLDITDEAFVQNFDEASIRDAATFNDRVYAINMGRVSYSGMFVNNDLLAEVGVALPTTWTELVAGCEAIVASGNECMTVGGRDGWPIFVGAYGLLGAAFPDQDELVEGLWNGDVKWNEGPGLELMEKFQVYTTEMLEGGVTGLGHDEATGRYAAGDVAFMPTGVWQAPALDEATFEWTYIPFPGSDNPEDNQYLFGKYDQGWAIAANTPNPAESEAYLAAFSEPDNYNAFINAVGFIPTQPTASLDTKLGQEVAPYLANYRVGFEQFWVLPTGAGQWADISQAPSWFAPFNEWKSVDELSTRIEEDLNAGLNG
jgi:raffinose/stachyose/melibiose transport system substrate-binding protein